MLAKQDQFIVLNTSCIPSSEGSYGHTMLEDFERVLLAGLGVPLGESDTIFPHPCGTRQN